MAGYLTTSGVKSILSQKNSCKRIVPTDEYKKCNTTSNTNNRKRYLCQLCKNVESSDPYMSTELAAVTCLSDEGNTGLNPVKICM